MDGIIFSDGASKGNPGRGGWGAIVSFNSQVFELGGRQENATNNQMELTAAIEGLQFALGKQITKAVFHSDSRYVLDGISKWIKAWQKNGWKTKEGNKVLNDALWKKLSELVYSSGISVKWNYTGGHVGIPANERVDEIASELALGRKVELFSGSLQEYGIDLNDLQRNEEKFRDKSAQRERSKKAAYSYVSEVDGAVKVHKTWSECEQRVRGQKARYRKSISPTDEAEIIKLFSIKN